MVIVCPVDHTIFFVLLRDQKTREGKRREKETSNTIGEYTDPKGRQTDRQTDLDLDLDLVYFIDLDGHRSKPPPKIQRFAGL